MKSSISCEYDVCGNILQHLVIAVVCHALPKLDARSPFILEILYRKLLDKLRQPPYHETEGIQLSSSVQIKQQENNLVGVLFLIFCTMCTLCLHNISRFLPTQAETRL